MESGLEDRNNQKGIEMLNTQKCVSMESGLEDRNNSNKQAAHHRCNREVSMESGLEDRNNPLGSPSWPHELKIVSMESGLEDRNNRRRIRRRGRRGLRLNGVRPRRPEQSRVIAQWGANGIGVSMESGLEDRNNLGGHVLMIIVAPRSQWSPA